MDERRASGMPRHQRFTWRNLVDRRPLSVAAIVTGLAGLAIAVPGSLGVGPVAQAGAVAAAHQTDACAPTWVTAWQAAPQAAPAGDDLPGATLRMIVQPQASGDQLRIRLSNAYGEEPLRIGATSVGRSAGGADLADAATPLTFAAGSEVVIPAGDDRTSDPLPMAVEAGQPLAISVYLADVPDVLTQHSVALRTSFVSGPGDATTSDGDDFPDSVASWSVLTGVDVHAAQAVNGLVAVGDSITDGVGSEVDVDERWTDALARRLTDPAAAPASAMVVLNAGISRNRLLGDDPVRDGDSPLTRFDRDVLAAAGVTDVILHIGTNDIAVGSTPAEIVEGLRHYVSRAKAAGKRVFLTTITPSDAGAHGTRGASSARGTVNTWILNQGPTVADGVFDFAAAVTDPEDPDRLAPEFDSGDGLHLSADGYQALADAIDVGKLTGSPCLIEIAPHQ